mmetsp:Transcript_30239/g.97502  ORF Transcript_30239/g.97502 Transcript_30239/m.97502 type:complete len:230 (-) Transcript_30239:259-948(-)|eukprot:CAMPEP_0118908976 /NCGR_PEP_ID=MMETSP1166-20130328/11757_1 /TAXON_ID=1104430 /ORGANISM="Chrysoreinhardia sp, Strain CCMP3193" /LENGTH=229 /DNA_ID=CAMNT_0006848387 /DNA_START=97 /DNA_END=786 /DNA_ORIENTATION=-
MESEDALFAAALQAALRGAAAAEAVVPPRVRVEQAALAAKSGDEVKALRVILRNVRDWPSIARYRRLKLSNAAVDRLWKTAARQVLEATGWVERGEVVELETVDTELATLALEILEAEDEPQRPDVCQLCGRPVAPYGVPPGGTFFRRARAPWEGVVCLSCPDFLICGNCYNRGTVDHDPDHVLAPLGYEEGRGMLSKWGPHRGGGGAPPRRKAPSPHDTLHGRRGPWG